MEHSLFVDAYRLTGRLLAPAAGLLLDYRTKKGKEDRARRDERLGRASRQRLPGPLIWLHAASVGEVNAALPLAGRIQASGINVLVTTGTVTSAQIVGKQCGDGLFHQYVPLDMAPFIDRFLDYWRPDLAIFVESELWPGMMVALRARNIPQALVNGRISERSFRRWQRVPRLAETLIGSLSLCLAQSRLDGQRFSALGARRVAVAGNLKFDSPPPAADPAMMAALGAALGRRPAWVAASTHAGEETAAIGVHRALKPHYPDLLTIIAPRHPHRGEEISVLARGSGLDVARRSRDGAITERTDIYIADTIGEMGGFYRLCPVAFIGGSLIPHGGQNPIEPVKLGTVVLHGPHVDNFRDVYEVLDRSGGVARIADTRQLARGVGALLADEGERERRSRLARRALVPLLGALERTLEALSPFLMPLAIHARLDGKSDD